jgi:hypothetical protein
LESSGWAPSLCVTTCTYDVLQVRPPVLPHTDSLLPGFLWYLWAAAKPNGARLRDVTIADSVVMGNGRVKAWLFYSRKERRVRSYNRCKAGPLHCSTALARLCANGSKPRPDELLLASTCLRLWAEQA